MYINVECCNRLTQYSTSDDPISLFLQSSRDINFYDLWYGRRRWNSSYTLQWLALWSSYLLYSCIEGCVQIEDHDFFNFRTYSCCTQKKHELREQAIDLACIRSWVWYVLSRNTRMIPPAHPLKSAHVGLSRLSCTWDLNRWEMEQNY